MSAPSIQMVVFASLMRPEGTTGVQTHMREFHDHLLAVGQPHRYATPFYRLGAPVLWLLIALRMLLERLCKPAAVWLYRHGHAAMLWLHLRYLMRTYPICVVYAQCPMSAAVALRCVRYPGQKVVLVVHFNVSQADEWIGKGMIAPGGACDRQIRACERAVLPRVHGLVYVSRFMEKALHDALPALARVKSAVIPNFVRPLLSTEAVAHVQGRDLVSIGTLESRKNQRFLLEVLARAKARDRRLTLTLVGDGPDRGMLERLTHEMGIESQVFFEGFSPGARVYIPGHRLYVHAALMENLSIVLIEALSAGVPVLAARVGGLVEIFSDGVEGRFWPLDDVDLACDMLLSLLDDDQALARMSAAAKARFQARFEASAVGQQLLTFLGEV